MSKDLGIALLKNNLKKVEEKFIGFFKEGRPRWPKEEQDYLRNHYAPLENHSAANITFEKLKLEGLPENILHEIRLAFEAFKQGEEYS